MPPEANVIKCLDVQCCHSRDPDTDWSGLEIFGLQLTLKIDQYAVRLCPPIAAPVLSPDLDDPRENPRL